MDLLRLTLEDFMGHRLTDIDCTKFSTVLIVGKNKNNDGESNGVGKSTIFKAIDYVLFGEYSSGILLDELVRDGCSKCSVTLEFTVTNGTYKITRTRNKKSKKSELFIWKKGASNWDNIGQKTPSEIEFELAKIIKISYKAFKNSILFAQADLNGLASATNPEDRRLILKEALGLTDYSKMEKIAKEDITELNKKIATQQGIITSIGTPDIEIKTMEQRLKSLIDSSISKIQEREITQSSLIELRSKLNELKTSLSSEASVINDKLIEVKRSKLQIRQAISKITNTINDKTFSLNNSTSQLDKKITLLKETFNKQEKLNNLVLRDSATVQNEIETISNNEMNGRAYISTQENKIKKLQLPIPDGDACPHCRQTLSVEHRNICREKDKEEIQKILEDLTISRKKLSSIQNKKISLQQELKSLNQHTLDLNDIQQRISHQESDVIFSQQYIKQISQMIEESNAELVIQNNIFHDLDLKEMELEDKTKQLAIDDVTSKINKTKLEADELEIRLHQILQEISADNTHVGIVTERISNRKKDFAKLETLNLELKILEKELKLRQMVSQAFCSGGIPTMIIYSILDDLQIEANNFLHQIRPGLELQFDPDSLAITYRVNGIPRSYKLLSGGQMLMIALALKIGLSMVIQHRLGVDIKFLELDEVDQSLDRSAVDALADVLKKLQDRFKVFMITHNDRLKDKFSTAISIENDGLHGATGKVVSSW